MSRIRSLSADVRDATWEVEVVGLNDHTGSAQTWSAARCLSATGVPIHAERSLIASANSLYRSYAGFWPPNFPVSASGPRPAIKFCSLNCPKQLTEQWQIHALLRRLVCSGHLIFNKPGWAVNRQSEGEIYTSEVTPNWIGRPILLGYALIQVEHTHRRWGDFAFKPPT